MSIKKLIGSRQFYKSVLTIALPIMIQNGITNFVNLLDNIMVGQLGTEQMSSVSIVNQLMFVFNLLIFGAVSGAGIFTAQYHGKNDIVGVRNTFKIKLLFVGIATVAAITLFSVFDSEFISLFLHSNANDIEGDLELTLELGIQYLKIAVWGLIPYAMTQAYSSTLRETEETLMPMIASATAIGVNFVFNYIFIFGKFGIPAFGVRGAAIATVIARIAELGFIVIWTHTHKERNPFVAGLFRNLKIPGDLLKSIIYKGFPLMMNEFFWSLAVTTLNFFYSTRGLNAVAAINIASTVNNVFNIVYLSLGATVGIIIGNLLGAGNTEKAKETAGKLIAFSVFCSVTIGTLLIIFADLFPEFYNTSDEIKSLAAIIIRIYSGLMAVSAMTNSTYFTIRSGGKVIITILFDSIFMWVITVPTALILTYFTGLDIKLLILCCQSLEIIKAGLSFAVLKSGIWINKVI